MERVNLNVPREVRRQLRDAARRRGLTESETARELLARSLAQEEREEVYRQFAAAMTPEYRRYLIKVARKWQRVRGY
jgi:hypothetical protein